MSVLCSLGWPDPLAIRLPELPHLLSITFADSRFSEIQQILKAVAGHLVRSFIHSFIPGCLLCIYYGLVAGYIIMKAEGPLFLCSHTANRLERRDMWSAMLSEVTQRGWRGRVD